MTDSTPSWAILDRKVWSLLNRNSVNYSQARKLVIKYIYRLSTAKDLQGRKLLWLPFQSSTSKFITTRLNEITNQNKQDKDSNNNEETDLWSKKKKSVAYKGNIKFFNQNSLIKPIKLNHFDSFDNWKTDWLKLTLSIPNKLFNFYEAQFFANKPYYSHVKAAWRRKSFSINEEILDDASHNSEIFTSKRYFSKNSGNYFISDYNPRCSLSNSSVEEGNDCHHGLIVKYVYYLNMKKDSNGNSIVWHDENELKNSNIISKITSQSEIISEQYRLLKYEFIENCNDISADQDEFLKELPENLMGLTRLSDQNRPSFTLKLKETTFYSQESLHTDPDLQKLLHLTSNPNSQRGRLLLDTDANTSRDQLQKSISSSGYSSYSSTQLIDDPCDDVTMDDLYKESVYRHRGISSYLPSDLNAFDYESSETVEEEEKEDWRSPDHSEKVTFKVICGIHPYTAVFHLEDDIELFKTFIYVISGMPPRRQKYFSINKNRSRDDGSKRIISLRDLGFNNGDVVYLEVVEWKKK